jgi:hypothetical protein
MKQNIVFFPASPEIRSSLVELGLDFISIKLPTSRLSEALGYLEPAYMVMTNQLELAKQLAKKHNIHTFYISDNQRQTFRLDLTAGSYLPTKLGTLQRSLSQEGSGVPSTGTFFLTVTEDNKTYTYVCK